MTDNHDGPLPGEFSGEVFPGLLPVQYRAMQVVLGEGGDDPLLAVMLELRTPAGIHITFWPDDTAIGLAQQLFETGEATSRGERLPRPVDGPMPDAEG